MSVGQIHNNTSTDVLRPAVILCLVPFLVSCGATHPTSDPSEIILEAFKQHQVVAVGENHGHLELHDWILDFLAMTETQETIDDVVVEWGNALYQDLIDRYIAGKDVPFDSVSLAWQNTIVSPNTVWDAPVYKRFFRHVRELNLANKARNQYRVILADTPVDWNKVESRQDLQPFFDRSNHMAERLRKESLLNGRHSLELTRFDGLSFIRQKRDSYAKNKTSIPAGI